LDHAISKLKKYPEILIGNISTIVHIATLEAKLRDRYNLMTEKQMLKKYKNGLEILNNEINYYKKSIKGVSNVK
jgi:hypothetical protein